MKHESINTGAESMYLIKCIGKTGRVAIRNNIRRKSRQGSVSKMFDRMELRCFGHLIRMDSNRKPWKQELKDRRGCGWPRVRGRDVRKLARRKGNTLRDATSWQATRRRSGAD